MQLYWYSTRLAIWHPSIDPEEITRVLGVKARACGQAGQPRKTPRGTPLAGVWRESWWKADLFDRGECVSTDDLVVDIVTEYLEVLEPQADFLRRLWVEGGRGTV